ncbi:mechanosensitive ion channel [Patescibacteria group bacterium]|nr:mechanosensitive ion channel [Patescibacteria group bacterium]MBU1702977.1 mechanosensitive ion channel [Patescibacteria group bacterium]
MANIPVTTTGNIGTESSSGIDFQSLLPQILEKFVQVIEASLVLVISVFVIRYIRKRLQKLETQHEQQKTAINLLEKIISGFIVVISITVALKIVGIDISLLVSVGVLGLSYGLQDIIKNYVAGILILFKAPFKIGDIVKIKSFTGKVAKMDFQSTSIETFDNRHITIYNKDIMTQSIVNYTKNDQRRLELDITIGYGSDTNKALETFNKILAAHPKVLKSPKFSVVYKKFSEVGTTFTLKFWVQRPCNILKIRTDIAAQITSSLDEQQIYMPFYKGIEVANEAGLQDITENHKKRIGEFFNLPIFAAPTPTAAPIPLTTPEGQPLTPEQQAAIAEEEMPDFEEPE